MKPQPRKARRKGAGMETNHDTRHTARVECRRALLGALKGVDDDQVSLRRSVLGRGCRRCGSRHRCANEIVCSRHRRDARQSRPWRLAPYQSAYDQQRFSPLTQINKGNVAQLRMAWSRGLPVGVQESTPIVYRGVMYVMAPGGSVQALDATNGDLIWEYSATTQLVSRRRGAQQKPRHLRGHDLLRRA